MGPEIPLDCPKLAARLARGHSVLHLPALRPQDHLYDECPSQRMHAFACRAMIESLNRVIRKTTKTRGSFPTDDAATKLIYLAIRKFENTGRSVREWVAARNQFAILYPERFNR